MTLLNYSGKQFPIIVRGGTLFSELGYIVTIFLIRHYYFRKGIIQLPFLSKNVKITDKVNDYSHIILETILQKY